MLDKTLKTFLNNNEGLDLNTEEMYDKLLSHLSEDRLYSVLTNNIIKEQLEKAIKK